MEAPRDEKKKRKAPRKVKRRPNRRSDEAKGDDDEAGSAVSTHVRGPRRWFEARATTADAVTLDFDWIAAFVLLTLRQLQMARQWTWQQLIALAFDDLTEGHYGAKLMPFLEQAQQKLAL